MTSTAAESRSEATPAPRPDQVQVAIIGAGIGGLAAAVALRHVGIDAHVFERTQVLREVGGAVVLRQPSLELLQEWGIAAGFLDQAVAVDLLERLSPDGTSLGTMSADFAGDGQAYSVHRADVHDLLLHAVPAEKIHLGTSTVEVVNDGAAAVAHFSDGGQVRASVVVGADGIRSVTRSTVVQDELVFSDLVVLRGLAPAAALPAGMVNNRLVMWGTEQHSMVLLPLRAGTQVAMDTVITQSDPPEDLWNTEVPTQTLLESFAGFDQSLLDLIAAGITPVRANPVYEREPLSNWKNGRITLLGDAAHPMAPRQGQGANQAIQDAGALAAALTETELHDPTAALQAYQSVRIPPTSAAQIASRTRPAQDVAR